ncbi:MAG: VWA domain-containing protein [Blastocatellia bacterium]|nr:VWA domain-containing protein [Blastocatellia bacterium]
MRKRVQFQQKSAARWPRIPGAVALIIVLIIVAIPVVQGQSGRAPSPDSKGQGTGKQKPNLPQPKIRLPESLPQPPKKEQDETITINSDLVTIVATIARKTTNDPIDLKAGDFEIMEDGVNQEIANFARDSDQPLNIVMLYDTSLSVARRLEFERRASARFFEKILRPQDRAAVFAVSTDVVLLQDFTNRVPLLVNAVKQLKAQGATSLYDAVFLASDYMKDATGRRVIIIVSDGGDTTSHKGLLEVLTKAQQEDALIYGIYTGAPNPSQNLRDLAAERALETLTSETGGEVLRAKVAQGLDADDTDDLSLRELDLAFSRLAEQLRTQYILGFFSTNEKRDGSYRKLSVRIKRAGYAARTRTGYYAPKN